MLHRRNNSNHLHLYQAIKTGDKRTAQILIYGNVDINAYVKGNTPLHWAIYNFHDLDIMTMLLHRKANIHAKNHENYTPLQIAIDNNRMEAALLLIQYGAHVGENLNSLLLKVLSNRNGIVQLCFACKNQSKTIEAHSYYNTVIRCTTDRLMAPTPVVCEARNLEIVRILLESGANPNTTNLKGETPLLLSCKLRYNSSKMIQLLLKHKANIEAANAEGWTPLVVAYESKNYEVIKFLLENHVNPNSTNREGQTPLHLSCELASKMTPQILQLLLEYGANIEAMNAKGWTPFFVACDSKNYEAIKFLLENHVNPNSTNREGQTPLHLSCEWASKMTPQILQLLLEYDANMEAENSEGWTPLFVACDSKNDEAVKFLLENRANPNARDCRGRTPLHVHCERVDKMTPKIIQLLLEYGANIEATDAEHLTPLFVACESRNDKAVKFLLENHANPNVRNREGQTPLHLICQYTSEITSKITQSLLKHNANIEATDENGWTPLFVACILSSNAAVKCLLENHANPNVRNREGQTPLHLICQYPNNMTPKIIQILLEHEANVEAVDENGWTPLFVACGRKTNKVTEIFLKNHAHQKFISCITRPVHLIYQFSGRIAPKIMEFVQKHEVPRHLPVRNRFDSNIDVIECLLKYGVNLNVLDKRNRSPLQHAIESMLLSYPENSNIDKMTYLRRDESIQILVSQVVKLKIAELNVDKCNYITIDEVQYSANDISKYYIVSNDDESIYDFWDIILPRELDIKCEKEIEKMKMERIGIDDMTFYDLLKHNIHLLGKLMEDEKNQEILKLSTYDEKFPLYIDIITSRLRDAKLQYKRYKLKKSAREYFSLNINQRLLDECIDKVLDYLTIIQLETFIENFKSVNS